MFNNFFYTLKEVGIYISPTAFLTLQRALNQGLINSVNEFYTTARSILIKSERYFDLYDQVFAHHFKGVELPDYESAEMEEMAKALLEEWLKNPKEIADILGIDESELLKLSPEELLEYFKERLKEQDERHDEGNKWIGTGGTSPVGNAGYNPSGMRVGGVSRMKSAIASSSSFVELDRPLPPDGRITPPPVGDGVTTSPLGSATGVTETDELPADEFAPSSTARIWNAYSVSFVRLVIVVEHVDVQLAWVNVVRIPSVTFASQML